MSAHFTRVARAEDLEWQLRARCRGMSTEIFFLADGERGARKAAREEFAKRICRACLVRQECLRHAVAYEEPHGIWGATTPSERAQRNRMAVSLRTGDGEPRKPV